MSLKALNPGYTGEVKDRIENFHGNQLLYVGWDHHLMFCAPFTFPVPPDMPFGRLRDEVMAAGFSPHPEWSLINWNSATWLLDGKPFVPVLDQSLQQQGIDHKSLLRFQTPELQGFMSAAV
jgi:phenol hydroxylase P4 protein